MLPKLDFDTAYTQLNQLLTLYGPLHTQIDGTRLLTRRRQSDSGPENREMLRVKLARAFALLQLIAAYVSADPKRQVVAQTNTKSEDRDTSTIERFLAGLFRAFYPRVHNYRYQANLHLVESGAAPLQLQFDPNLARYGQFPFNLIVHDPRNCAFSWSNLGLEAAAVREWRYAGPLLHELRQLQTKSGKGAFEIPPSLIDLAEGANPKGRPMSRGRAGNPYQKVMTHRYYTRFHEYYFVEGDGVFARSHMMGGDEKESNLGRVPFVVCEWGVPSERPEERCTGFIAPEMDSLQNLEVWLEMIINGISAQWEPLVAVYDRNSDETRIIKAQPSGQPLKGEARPIAMQFDPQLGQLAQQEMEQDIARATAPESLVQGVAAGGRSGYQLRVATAGFDARMGQLIEALQFHDSEFCSLLLEAVKYFNTPEMADSFKLPYAQYKQAFSVISPFRTNRSANRQSSKQRLYARLSLSAEEIGEHTQVITTLTPDAPTDKNAKIQRTAQALQSGLPFEEVVRNIYEADYPEEVLDQHRIEWLIKNDQDFAAFWKDYQKKQLFGDNKDLGREHSQWMDAQMQQAQSQTWLKGHPLGNDGTNGQGGPGQGPGAGSELQGPGPANGMPPGLPPGMEPGMPPGMEPGMPPGMPPGISPDQLPPALQSGTPPSLPPELMGAPPGSQPIPLG